MLSVIVISSKMIVICNCCNGCTSTRQLSIYPRYRFSKKLLVAIALIVIVTMFITPTESRAVEKRRHRNKHLGCCNRWEIINNKSPSRKRILNGTRAEIFNREVVNVLQKLKNTKSYFKYKVDKDMLEYEETPPSWLPKVRFAGIHYYYLTHENKSRITPEEKFKFLMPKLHRSLVEYEQLLKFYNDVYLDFPDTIFNSYKNKRQTLLKEAIGRIAGTIAQVEDSMLIANMTVPIPKLKKIHLSKSVSESECLRLDFLAFRGYGNLLKNWITELRCFKKRQNPMIKKKCRQWERLQRRKLIAEGKLPKETKLSN